MEGRQHDPRRLSKRKPGRSEIQDDPPPIPVADPTKENREGIGDYRRTEGIRPDESEPSPATVEKREARRRGAMPLKPRKQGPNLGKLP